MYRPSIGNRIADPKQSYGSRVFLWHALFVSPACGIEFVGASIRFDGWRVLLDIGGSAGFHDARYPKSCFTKTQYKHRRDDQKHTPEKYVHHPLNPLIRVEKPFVFVQRIPIGHPRDIVADGAFERHVVQVALYGRGKLAWVFPEFFKEVFQKPCSLA